MRVAILHYHLRAGGVGSVIRSQARCLQGAAEVHLLLGEEPRRDPGLGYTVLPGLAYGAGMGEGGGAEADLAEAIERALRDRFGGGCDVLHAHNPLIRKNGSLSRALDILAKRGARILVQAHDFAEDFRPDVYFPDQEYPEGCFYAALNARDGDNLVASGIDGSSVFVLPNAVSLPEKSEPRRGFAEECARGRRTALYPVRAIRRKNIGEALLLSRFLPRGAEVAVTLPPTSPAEIPSYGAWKETAVRGDYPIRFEAGKARELGELYEGSFCALTTSVKEGFGFTFLDPPARGIPVVGRSVPYTVSDFMASGVELGSLYRELRVPASKIPEGDLREALDSRLDSLRLAYAAVFSRSGGGAKAASDELESILAHLAERFDGDVYDFGALDVKSQAKLLRLYDEDASLRAEIAALNPFLESIFEAKLDPSAAERMRNAIESAYSEDRQRERLVAAYETVASRDPSGRIDRGKLLRRMLVRENFFLCAS